jgi:hypothetical protein
VPPPLPNVLRIYRNTEWAYELRVPDVWHQRPLDIEDGQGMLFTPDPVETATALSVELSDLGTDVTPADLPDLEQGFLNGLRGVPESEIVRHESFVNDLTFGLETVQTYLEAGQRRKRWINLLYRGSRQARLIAQAATVEEFDRLRPLFAPCVSTFMFGARSPA